MIVVKTQLGEDFRRFTVPRQVRLLSLVALLQKLYGYDAKKNDLVIKYKDEEGARLVPLPHFSVLCPSPQILLTSSSFSSALHLVLMRSLEATY